MPLSSRLKVRSESLALALDITATARLKIYDEEKEARLIEALATGSTNMAVNAITQGFNQASSESRLNRNIPRQ